MVVRYIICVQDHVDTGVAGIGGGGAGGGDQRTLDERAQSSHHRTVENSRQFMA